MTHGDRVRLPPDQPSGTSTHPTYHGGGNLTSNAFCSLSVLGSVYDTVGFVYCIDLKFMG